jgi:plastocyanin
MKRKSLIVVLLIIIQSIAIAAQPASANGIGATAQVRKTTVPASSGLWTFTLTGPNGLSETLSNVQAGAGYAAFSSSLVSQGGTYTITETSQTGYDLTDVSGDIFGDSARVTTSVNTLSCSFTLDLTTDNGHVFECSFTNTQEGSIIVKKVTNPVGASGSFTFTGNATGTIGDGGTITVNNLAPGTYTSTEADPTPAFDLTGISCNDGASATVSTVSLATRKATFKLDPGETVTCTFTDRQRGTIIVKKVTNPVGASGSFTFTGNASGTIGDGGTITVNDLAPGTYTSTETSPAPAFDLTGISCNDGASATVSTVSLATRTATFKLDPGETVTCTFTDRQRGHAKVEKTVGSAAPTGSQAFTFQLRSGASGGSAGTILETGVANAGDGGVINFTTYLVPGTTYQLCEQIMPGWLTSLGPPLFTVYNPSGDNSVVCTDFIVTAGQLKTFNIDNTPPPGGRALSIGFWKNWASCAASNGNKKPVLDQTMLAAANAGQPITIGTLVLDPNVLGASTACRYAVDLLSKSTLSAKKMSSDRLFKVAAELLAADLNVAAGAGVCPSAAAAINQAQALLLKYNFDGNTYSPKLSAIDTVVASQLATTLDDYNNNLLC